VPTLISLCMRATPRSCSIWCAWPMTFMTSSHDPSVIRTISKPSSQAFLPHSLPREPEKVSRPIPRRTRTQTPTTKKAIQSLWPPHHTHLWNPLRKDKKQCKSSRHTNSSSGRVHGIVQSAPLHQSLHLRYLLRYGSCRCAEGDQAEICHARWRGADGCKIDRGSHCGSV
jgi:hypothetical protein